MVTILGIKLDERLENSLNFQKILSKYGCEIRTRLGLHSSENNSCTNWGIIILEFTGDEKSLNNFEKEISLIDGAKFGKIIF